MALGADARVVGLARSVHTRLVRSRSRVTQARSTRRLFSLPVHAAWVAHWKISMRPQAPIAAPMVGGIFVQRCEARTGRDETSHTGPVARRWGERRNAAVE